MAYKIIAIIGEAGSGKDTLMKKALSAIPELNEIISCTTRPPREGEIDGINYNFISEEEFKQQRFLESTSFNGWMYGTPYNALSMSKINIGVFNPSGVRELLKNKNFDVKVYRVRASDKERLLRQLNREKNPNIKEIIRRFDLLTHLKSTQNGLEKVNNIEEFLRFSDNDNYMYNCNGDINEWWWYACNYIWENFPPLYWGFADILNKAKIDYTPLFY